MSHAPHAKLSQRALAALAVLVTLVPLAPLACGQSEGASPGAAPSAQPALRGAPVARASSAEPAEDPHDETSPREPFRDGAKTFASVKQSLQEGYYAEGITEDDLYRAAVEGMLERVEPKMRKWNKLLTPTELAEIRTDLKGEVIGIGVQIKFDAESGYTDVLGTIPGSPSEKAGLVAGDKIVTVNGKLFKGTSLRDVVAEMRGKVGEPVALTVLRADKLLSLSVKREVVPYDHATSMLLPDGVGYLRVRSFTSKTAPATKAALEELTRKNARGLVVDLRGNQGGSFDDAVSTAELLLPSGAGIVTLKKRGESESRIVAKGAPLLTAVPMAVLVDGSTSSGAELVAAALQEGRKAHVVGSHTFGKWSVQTLEDLPNGYAIKYTVSLFRSPSGRTFDGAGLAPDVEVSMDAKAVEKAQTIVEPNARLAADVQLRTAATLVRPR